MNKKLRDAIDQKREYDEDIDVGNAIASMAIELTEEEAAKGFCLGLKRDDSEKFLSAVSEVLARHKSGELSGRVKR